MPIKFSVVIPCYNQANYLLDCYLSLISQKHKNWEAIIINDGSTDNADDVITQITRFDKRVITIKKTNGGLSSARNAGIKAITGDFVIFLDADDMLLPYCLKDIQIQLLKKPTIQWVQVGYRHISQSGNTVYKTVNLTSKKNILPDILFNNKVPVHSNCISKKLISKTGFFDEALKSCEDWDYWIRAALIDDNIAVIEEPLVDYRMNNDSMSRDSFVLYKAMKTVTIRSKELYQTLNKNYQILNVETRFMDALKNNLVMCLGVSIVQKKIDESIQLFEEETHKNNFKFIPNDFKLMSSYLIFRYQTSDADVIKILNEHKPLFINFFQKIGYSKTIIKQCIWAIFSKHYHILYKKKLGNIGVLFHKLKAQTV